MGAFVRGETGRVHLKVNQVRRPGRTYQYAQLVQSVRDDRGKPVHKVVAKLGALDALSIDNLRAALKANRHGQPVVVAEGQRATKLLPVPVRNNLAFLDVMAMLQLWQDWELPKLMGRLLGRDGDEVAAEHVVAALTIQRVVEPGSKLSAVSWFPHTCLPEFLRVAPDQFNNSRVHRVLESLEDAGPALQKNLPMLYMQHKGKPEALFLDVTDVRFEGRGPELAERCRTKEGLRNRRKVGITMLCDERGIPLQWQVTPGKRDDRQCMGELLDAIEDEFWVGAAPVVCDRAMGQASGVDRLLRSGLRFLTAVPRREMGSYGVTIPAGALADLEPNCKFDPTDDEVTDIAEAQDCFAKDVERACEAISAAGLERVDDTQFVVDLGTGTRPITDDEIAWIGPDDIHPAEHVGGASMLAWARIFERALQCGEVKNRAHIAQLCGLSRARVTELLRLLQLAPSVQQELFDGAFGAIPERGLRQALTYRSPEQQRDELVRVMGEQQEQPTTPRMGAKKLRITYTEPVRCVAYFNPEMFVRQRLRERKRHQQLMDFVEQLNKRLASPRCRFDEHRTRFEITERLARDHQLSLYDVELKEVQTAKRMHLKLEVTRNDREWQRRRKYHGFVLLVAHAELPHSAVQLAKLYRDKDAIERDFRLIKSALELRPVYHRTDEKVRAHVTLCALALLLERALEVRLEAAGIRTTADAALRTLMPGHLNRFEPHELLDCVYSVTRPTAQQRTLLKALRLGHLTRDREVAALIRPR